MATPPVVKSSTRPRDPQKSPRTISNGLQRQPGVARPLRPRGKAAPHSAPRAKELTPTTPTLTRSGANATVPISPRRRVHQKFAKRAPSPAPRRLQRQPAALWGGPPPHLSRVRFVAAAAYSRCRLRVVLRQRCCGGPPSSRAKTTRPRRDGRNANERLQSEPY